MRHCMNEIESNENKLISGVCVCVCSRIIDAGATTATYNFQSSLSILAYRADTIRISLRKTAQALICVGKRKKASKKVRTVSFLAID